MADHGSALLGRLGSLGQFGRNALSKGVDQIQLLALTALSQDRTGIEDILNSFGFELLF